jgi:hypothetical protein
VKISWHTGCASLVQTHIDDMWYYWPALKAEQPQFVAVRQLIQWKTQLDQQ